MSDPARQTFRSVAASGPGHLWTTWPAQGSNPKYRRISILSLSQLVQMSQKITGQTSKDCVVDEPRPMSFIKHQNFVNSLETISEHKQCCSICNIHNNYHVKQLLTLISLMSEFDKLNVASALNVQLFLFIPFTSILLKIIRSLCKKFQCIVIVWIAKIYDVT